MTASNVSPRSPSFWGDLPSWSKVVHDRNVVGQPMFNQKRTFVQQAGLQLDHPFSSSPIVHVPLVAYSQASLRPLDVMTVTHRHDSSICSAASRNTFRLSDAYIVMAGQYLENTPINSILALLGEQESISLLSFNTASLSSQPVLGFNRQHGLPRSRAKLSYLSACYACPAILVRHHLARSL